MHAQFHRQFDFFTANFKARGIHIFFKITQNGVVRRRIKTGGFEVGGQAHLQYVHFVFGRAEGLRVGAA